MLIPVGFQAIEEELQSEVMEVAGARYTRPLPNFKRWGCNEGSVFLGDQKVSVRVPRVRDVLNGKEIPFSSYQGFQNPGSIDEVVFKRLMESVLVNMRKRRWKFRLRLESRKVASLASS